MSLGLWKAHLLGRLLALLGSALDAATAGGRSLLHRKRRLSTCSQAYCALPFMHMNPRVGFGFMARAGSKARYVLFQQPLSRFVFEGCMRIFGCATQRNGYPTSTRCRKARVRGSCAAKSSFEIDSLAVGRRFFSPSRGCLSAASVLSLTLLVHNLPPSFFLL